MPELVKHYGLLHPVTNQLLKEAHRNHQLDYNFDLGNAVPMQINPEKCVICLRSINRLNLPSHSALIHFKDQYEADIKEKQNHYLMAPGRCPHPGCSFAVKFDISPGFLERRQIAMIKHYQMHVSVISIVTKYKINIGLLKKQAQARGSAPVPGSQLAKSSSISHFPTEEPGNSEDIL